MFLAQHIQTLYNDIAGRIFDPLSCSPSQGLLGNEVGHILNAPDVLLLSFVPLGDVRVHLVPRITNVVYKMLLQVFLIVRL